MMPASSMARMRSMTVSRGIADFSAMSWNGSRWKPGMRSSEMARILALVGSEMEVGMFEVIGGE